MTISWAHSAPDDLRRHHARDAAEREGPLPADVLQSSLPAQGTFRGGLLYTPQNLDRDGVILYFHGGGFLAGSPETHRCVTAWFAREAGMKVLSARYRLAPEYPFPAQAEDGVAAIAAARSQVEAENAPLFLAGDSAGACVALWTWCGLPFALRARIAGLVLFYGGFGQVSSDSITRHGTAENGLDHETLDIMYRRLGPQAVWPKDFAPEVTVPAYVLGAELDAVFDDSRLLFDALPESTANSFVTMPGQDHGFLKGAGKDAAAMQALAAASQWLAARM
ncbi:MAG TPA: alpha/beta hydrolase fold domain-containing protein [Terriglobales bacterium]|nr:alpha/beta hydrolase fold domain-containing protein [Terriglobales bacterium]